MRLLLGIHALGLGVVLGVGCSDCCLYEPDDNGHVEISSDETFIEDEAFMGCKTLKSITIPNSVTSIGSKAFWAATLLANVTLPDSITSMNHSAFGSTYGLSSINFPPKLTHIGDSMFYSSSLTNVIVPDSVTSIGTGVFQMCNRLTSVTIADSVTSIGRMAFYLTLALSDVTLPNSDTLFGSGVFSDGGLTSVTIPSKVTSVGEEMFSNCKSLTSVIIGSGVKSIGMVSVPHCLQGKPLCSTSTRDQGAFQSVDAATSFIFPAGITYIGDRAFAQCGGVSSVPLEAVAFIGEFAFQKTGLTDVTIPDSATSIGSVRAH
jgi:hypothetical protein